MEDRMDGLNRSTVNKMLQLIHEIQVATCDGVEEKISAVAKLMGAAVDMFGSNAEAIAEFGSVWKYFISVAQPTLNGKFDRGPVPSQGNRNLVLAGGRQSDGPALALKLSMAETAP